MLRSLMLAGATALVFTTGCMGPKGKTVAEKRSYADHMLQTTMDQVSATNPDVAAKAKGAAGYGVFSNIGAAWFVGGGGSGYGVVVDNKTGAKTYMKMVRGSLGLGLGAKGYKAVGIFHDPETLNSFTTSGWDFDGELSAAAKFSKGGGDFDRSGSIKDGIEVYQYTDWGLYARAAVGLGKAFPHKKLNEGG